MGGQLVAGAVDTYLLSTQPGTALLIEATDTSGGAIGLLKLRTTDLVPPQDTCQGSVAAQSAGAAMVEVSDCTGSDAGSYTVSLVVVSGGPDNCGVPLPCGTPSSAQFQIPGEVDSYSFPGVQGDQVTIAVTDVSSTIGAVRLRVFDPSGTVVSGGDSCAGSVHLSLPTTGRYTVLASACLGPQAGSYSIVWQPSACPHGVPKGLVAYVANADSANISVVDLETNTVRGGIPLAVPAQADVAVPIDLAITPNGGFAYATYASSTNVFVINSSTNLITDFIPAGLSATGVAIAPDGSTAYVLANDLGGIAVIDTRTRAILEIIPLGMQSDSIVITPDGLRLFVSSEDLEGVVEFAIAEPDHKTQVPTIVGDRNTLAISPNGAFVYAGSLTGLVVIDAAHRPVHAVTSLPLSEPFGIAFTPDGTRAYVATPDDSAVALIDVATHSVMQTIPVGVDPAGVAVSPDGGLVYVTDFTSGAADPGLFVIDTATNKVVASFPVLGDGPSAIALTTAPTGLCVGDAAGETKVTIDELVTSVNAALNGCPGRFPVMVAPVR